MNKPPGVKNELRLGTLKNKINKIQVCLVLLCYTISATLFAGNAREDRARILCKLAVRAIVDAAASERMGAAKWYQRRSLRKMLISVRESVVEDIMKDCKGGCTPEEAIDSLLSSYEVHLGMYKAEHPQWTALTGFFVTASSIAVLAGVSTHFLKDSGFGAVLGFWISTLGTPFLLGSGHALFQRVTARQALKSLSNTHLQRNMLSKYYNLAYWVEKATLTLIEAEARTCYDAYEAVITPLIIDVENELKAGNTDRAAKKFAYVVAKMHIGHPELDYSYPFFRRMIQTWIAEDYMHEEAGPEVQWTNTLLPKPPPEKPVIQWQVFQEETLKWLRKYEAGFREDHEDLKIKLDYRRLSIYLDFWLNPKPKLAIADEKKYIEGVWNAFGAIDKARNIDSLMVGNFPVVVHEFLTWSYLMQSMRGERTLVINLGEGTTVENFKERLAEMLTMDLQQKFQQEIPLRKNRISRFFGKFAWGPQVTVKDLSNEKFHLVILMNKDYDPKKAHGETYEISEYIKERAAAFPASRIILYNPNEDTPNPFERPELNWHNLDNP